MNIQKEYEKCQNKKCVKCKQDITMKERRIKTMYKVKIVIDGLVKEITVNANSSVEVQNIITNMYGTGKVQIIDIRRV